MSNESVVQIAQLTPLLKLTAFAHLPIPPGTTVEARDWLTLDLEKYFSEPGTYELQAKMANDDRTQIIESNIISFEVTQPTGIDLLAFNLIRNSTIQNLLFSGAEFRQAENTLRQLGSLYPTTAYGKSASFVLGEVYFFRKDYVQALAYLTRLENANDFIHAEKVRMYLAEIRRIAAPEPSIKQPKSNKPS
ncbi:MAG: tetratricopeptide repeat protein [Pyrinomonadaceae bacterium]